MFQGVTAHRCQLLIARRCMAKGDLPDDIASVKVIGQTLVQPVNLTGALAPSGITKDKRREIPVHHITVGDRSVRCGDRQAGHLGQ